MLIKAILLGLVGIVGVIDSRLIGRQNIGRPPVSYTHLTLPTKLEV